MHLIAAVGRGSAGARRTAVTAVIRGPAVWRSPAWSHGRSRSVSESVPERMRRGGSVRTGLGRPADRLGQQIYQGLATEVQQFGCARPAPGSGRARSSDASPNRTRPGVEAGAVRPGRGWTPAPSGSCMIMYNFGAQHGSHASVVQGKTSACRREMQVQGLPGAPRRRSPHSTSAGTFAISAALSPLPPPPTPLPPPFTAPAAAEGPPWGGHCTGHGGAHSAPPVGSTGGRPTRSGSRPAARSGCAATSSAVSPWAWMAPPLRPLAPLASAGCGTPDTGCGTPHAGLSPQKFPDLDLMNQL